MVTLQASLSDESHVHNVRSNATWTTLTKRQNRSLPSSLVQPQEQFGSQCRRIGERAHLLLAHLHRGTGWLTVLPGVQQQHHIAMAQACQAAACQRQDVRSARGL